MCVHALLTVHPSIVWEFHCCVLRNPEERVTLEARSLCCCSVLFEFPAKHVHTRAHSFLWAGALWPFVLFAAGGEEASGAFPTSVTTWRTESATLRLSRLVVFVSYLCNYLLVVPLHQPQPPPHLPSPLFYRLVVVSRHPMPSEHKKVTGPRHCKTRRYAAVSSRCHQTPFLSTPHPLISYPPPPAPPLPKRRS